MKYYIYDYFGFYKVVLIKKLSESKKFRGALQDYQILTIKPVFTVTSSFESFCSLF